MAVSGVMAAFPLMISLTVLSGRAKRCANSDCVSATVLQRLKEDLARRHSPVRPPRRLRVTCHGRTTTSLILIRVTFVLSIPPSSNLGRGVVVRLEDQSIRAPEIDRELAAAIGAKLMAVSGHTFHVRQRGRTKQGHQASLEEPPVVGSPALAALAVVRACLLQLLVRPRDLDDDVSLTVLTLRVKNSVA